jgi:hypothetical protein
MTLNFWAGKYSSRRFSFLLSPSGKILHKNFLCLVKNYSVETFGEWMFLSALSQSRRYSEMSGQLHAKAVVGKNAQILFA